MQPLRRFTRNSNAIAAGKFLTPRGWRFALMIALVLAAAGHWLFFGRMF